MPLAQGLVGKNNRAVINMTWTNSEVLAVASAHCARCDGLGFTRKADGISTNTPCRCVLREMFYICFKRFRDCATRPKHLSGTSLNRTSGLRGGRVWGRKTEEFIADFICIAKRTLGPGTFEYTLFRYIYLLGADEKLICRQMRLDRETFFNTREPRWTSENRP